MGKPEKVCREEPTKSSRWSFSPFSSYANILASVLPSQGVGGRTLPKVFCKHVWSEPGNLYHISDQRLRVFILLFRPEPKSAPHFRFLKLVHGSYMWAQLTGIGFHLHEHLRGATNLPTSMRKKSFLPGKTNYPIPSQREKHTLFQTKKVKFYALFQTGKTKYPIMSKQEGKAYPISDQNGENRCAFSDQNS